MTSNPSLVWLGRSSAFAAATTANVPPFVSLRGMARGYRAGIPRRGPSAVHARRREPQQSLAWPTASTIEVRINNRRELLEGFDDLRRDIDATGTMAGMDTFQQRAFDMIASGGVRTALDLSRETQATRQRYQGVDQFLTARRLVEAGVGCVTLSVGGWDTHGQNSRRCVASFRWSIAASAISCRISTIAVCSTMSSS